MSHSNQKAKNRLIEKYGETCFIERLHVRKDTNRKYTSRKQEHLAKTLTYHHIEKKSEGGKATDENGALLSAENHQWLHYQTEEVQDYLNDLLQTFKEEYDKGTLFFVDELPPHIKSQLRELKFFEFSTDDLEKVGVSKKDEKEMRKAQKKARKKIDEILEL